MTYCAEVQETQATLCESNGLWVNGTIPKPTSTSGGVRTKPSSVKAMIMLVMVLVIMNIVRLSATMA
jgi:hypothetical protein